MNKVAIVTDSTCDLSKEIIEKYDIKVIPLYVVYDDKTYRDGIDIHAKDIYERTDKDGVLPKTAALSPLDIHNILKPLIEEGYDIFYTGISSKMSGNFQNWVIAAADFEPNRIFLSDSGNLSTGIGLLVLKACEYRDAGCTAKQIKNKIDHIVPHVKVQFVIKKLDYLYKGGRCTSMSKVFGTLLRIHPMIVVRDGRMVVGKKIIGKMEKSILTMTDIFLKDFNEIDPTNVFITDSSLNDELYEIIYGKLKESGVTDKVKNIYHTHAGCVVSSHCGPDTIGILYIMKKGLHDDSLDQDAFDE